MGRDRRSDRGHRRTLTISFDSWQFASLTRIAELVGVEPGQLVAVWVHQHLCSDTPSAHGEEAVLGGQKTWSSVSTGNVRGRGAKPNRRASGALHDEIIAVMEEAKQPMTVAEIALAIRERGHYRPPRTGKPVTSDLVSRRVSNPTYRPLFRRDGRLLQLAHRKALVKTS